MNQSAFKIVGKTVFFDKYILRGNDFDLIIQGDDGKDINIVAESGTIKAYEQESEIKRTDTSTEQNDRSDESRSSGSGGSSEAGTGESGKSEPAGSGEQPKPADTTDPKGEENGGSRGTPIPQRPKSWIRGKAE